MYVEYIEVAMVNFLFLCLGSLLSHFLFQEHHDVIENLEHVVNQPEHCCSNHFIFAISVLQEENFHFCFRVDKTRRGVMGVVRKSQIVMQGQACKSVIVNIFHSCCYWLVKYSPTSSEDTKSIFNSSSCPWLLIVVDLFLFTCIFTWVGPHQPFL